MKNKFNEGWRFLKTEYGTDYQTAAAKAGSFEEVEIPHDWMIADANNLYKDNTGWYCNSLDIADTSGKTFLIFDGIYMDSVVYINGIEAGQWKNGYSQFVLDVSDYVKPGQNTVYVGVNSRYPSARWYTGAGIYRSVWVKEVASTYIPENGIYIHSEKEGSGFRVKVKTEVLGTDADRAVVSYALFDDRGIELELSKQFGGDDGKDVSFLVNAPKLWSPEEPNLYELKVELKLDGECIQEESVRTGFKDLRFDPAEGFFVNGEYTKIRGVCIHHDLGALGVAFDKNAMRRRLCQFKDLGVNAIRLSHNVYAPEVLDLADEMGFLIDSEAFDMWERAKTDYDYAAFWEEWHEKDVASWVRRDRNHVSVFMWSIGNEIYDPHADERGVEITKELRHLVEIHDPLKNALVTSASNYMPWENAQKCAQELEVVGYNYAENFYEKHHKEHPDWIIYGSETYSIVQSRGIYHFPLKEKILSDSDLQCSSLENSTTSWGAESIESCICYDRDLKYSLGQFIWTGYDYIGEPTPYHTKNSYFGLIDTAGFPKDAYYVWKSAWVSRDKDPFVHIFPYWDFNEGQSIDVRVASNGCKVELFLNGKSLGVQELTHERESGDHIIGDYSVIYEKGTLEAVAYDEKGVVIARDVRKSFGDAASLGIKAGKENSFGDLIFAEICALDAEGNPVENANNYVHVAVTGGRLIGLDNGDSTDYDSYKADTRRLFGGRMLAIIRRDSEDTEVNILASLSENKDIRAIKLVSDKGQSLGPDSKTIVVTANTLPSDAPAQNLVFRALNSKGTESNLAKIVVNGNTAEVTAVGDGSFRLRCEAYNGADSVKVISELEFEVSGIGTAYLDPYGYIYGSSYTSAIGRTGAGNEQGVASYRDEETVISFEGVDFGKDGSDEITVDIFGLSDDPYDFEIWKGIPGSEGAELIGKEIYHKKSIWNVYQPDTWTLNKKLTGIQTVSFKVFDKVHIKGFSFERKLRAYEGVGAINAESVYGDSFTQTADAVEGIGNNVTLNFGVLDLGEEGPEKVTITGRAPKNANTIHLRFYNEETGQEYKEILEFPQSKEYTSQTFGINKRLGNWETSFIFLPGSNFDFKAFIFG